MTTKSLLILAPLLLASGAQAALPSMTCQERSAKGMGPRHAIKITDAGDGYRYQLTLRGIPGRHYVLPFGTAICSQDRSGDDRNTLACKGVISVLDLMPFEGRLTRDAESGLTNLLLTIEDRNGKGHEMFFACMK